MNYRSPTIAPQGRRYPRPRTAKPTQVRTLRPLGCSEELLRRARVPGDAERSGVYVMPGFILTFRRFRARSRSPSVIVRPCSVESIAIAVQGRFSLQLATGCRTRRSLEGFPPLSA